MLKKNIETKEEFKDFVRNSYTQYFYKGKNKSFPKIFGIGQKIMKNRRLYDVNWHNINMFENFGFLLAILDSNGTLNSNDMIRKYFQPFVDDGASHPNIDALKEIGEEKPILNFIYSIDCLKRQISSRVDASFRLRLLKEKKFTIDDINMKNIDLYFPDLNLLFFKQQII